ncbi:MAG: flavin reductase (DIM6/NTAB) family NADH-FMN oxidoreductase RutF [Paraglaciecola sp.]|jgi:flavin reductase (DIM6/NTAB) family NADH-FMN oxidoreductase RutF
MLIIDPKSTPTSDLHQYLLGSVAPRPIAFASTIDDNGVANLAPYSFFNCFSSNPPTLVFSSNRRVAGNTTKDTLHNIEKNKEVVICVVNHAIVRQMTIASVTFPSKVSEFAKSGLTPMKADLVKPFLVKESPVNMECRVTDIISLGDQGGAGNLIICEVLRMHIDEKVLDEDKKIDPQKIDLMGRMGRAFYVRASGDAVQKIFQPVVPVTIGFDELPESVRTSSVLTGNNLGQLAGMNAAPSEKDVLALKEENVHIQDLLKSDEPLQNLHHFAKKILDEGDSERDFAAKVLWIGNFI